MGRFFVAALVVAALYFLFRSESPTVSTPAAPAEQSASPDAGQPVPSPTSPDTFSSRHKPEYAQNDPSDYFPTQVGDRWDYAITLGEAEPLQQRYVNWPVGNMVQASREIGRFTGTFTRSGQREFALSMSVAGPATQQGPLHYPQGVELKILRDDLGVYEHTKNVYWAITRSDRYEALEVAIFSGDSPGAPRMDPWGMGEDGYSMRLAFFGSEPGIAIGFGDKPIERLGFEGSEQGLLHFRRVYSAYDEDDSRPSSDRTFSGAVAEDLYFQKGQGLVLLQQTRDGVPSMTWKLKSFNGPAAF